MQIKYGIKINGELPDIADKYKGHDVIILGAGFNFFREFDEARRLYPSAQFMAVNNSIVGIEWFIRTDKIKIEHWASLHPEHFYFGNIWMRDMYITHGERQHPETQYVWPINGDGSSGLLATKIAMLLGYSRIILCGIPLDDVRRYYDHPEMVYRMADPAILMAWDDFKGAIGPEEGKRIIGLSGYPKQLFGGPRG